MLGRHLWGNLLLKATGREFYRISLGGLRDEAEIRGHRRTYIGSMPGKIIQAMRKCETKNPLILLDEIDKIGSDWRGDPAAALLEVLDPEQNKAFQDHYLEVDYDLSNVLFVATANSYNMPAPLLDRLEIIKLSGYTEDEKHSIAKEHLIPKQKESHGLSTKEITIPDETISELIRYYTREAGVRNLERELARICRKGVLSIMRNEQKTVKVDAKLVQKYCGPHRFKYGVTHETNLSGITNGMAWTEVGGDLLKVEAVVLDGSGKTLFTGKLGDVMRESIETAISLVRERSKKLDIKKKFWKDNDIHVHVPEGATPKDGPSAGIAMFISIVSALTGQKVKKDIAMTGEISLVGRVFQIGGLKEKLLAAHRGGIKTVLIPKENEKDMVDIPDKIKKDLKIVFLETVDDALKHAFSSVK